MNAKHTPGPWVIVDAGNEPSVYISRQDGSHVRVAYADHCFAQLDGLTEPEWSAASHQMRTANARLIAAAPDLLAALRCADEWMSCVEGQLRDGQLFKRDRETIRAAISKAEGEHQ